MEDMEGYTFLSENGTLDRMSQTVSWGSGASSRTLLLKQFQVHGKVEQSSKNFHITASSCPPCAQPPLIKTPTRGACCRFMSPRGHNFTPGPTFTSGFTVAVVHPKGLDKFTELCIHHCNNIHRSFPALKPLSAPPFPRVILCASEPPLPTAQQPRSSYCLTVLTCPECHMLGSHSGQTVFSDGFFHVVTRTASSHGWIAHFSLAVNTIHCLDAPQFTPSPTEEHLGCVPVCAGMSTAAVNICVQVFRSFG